MSNLHTAIAEANEIMKATDFTFGYDSSIENVTTALRVVLSNSAGDFIIGGKVKPYSLGGLNVSVDPIYAYHDITKTSVAETEITEPITFERADNSFNRIDIVQVRGIKEGYDTQIRKFNNPQTGAKTNRQVPTKKCIRLEVSVKKGANGSDTAPIVDAGCVKIAEVVIPAGVVNITENLIKNVTAQKYQDVNETWTANQASTFTPGYLTDIKQEIDAKIDAVHESIATLDVHANNTANPHNVTAAQTGAYSKQETDTKMTEAAKQYTDQLLIKIFENGYIQWPGMPTPDTLFTFEGYRWAEVDYNGCFFRAKGEGANPFDGEEQGDAIRNIKGTFGPIDDGESDRMSSIVSGCFQAGSRTVWDMETSGYDRDGFLINFDASRVVPTAEENRPRNKTFIIWKLEKI